MSDKFEIKRALIEKAVDLLHMVLCDKAVNEDLRLRLLDLREDLSWELEQADSDRTS